jgi:hypothetical protein
MNAMVNLRQIHISLVIALIHLYVNTILYFSDKNCYKNRWFSKLRSPFSAKASLTTLRIIKNNNLVLDCCLLGYNTV